MSPQRSICVDLPNGDNYRCDCLPGFTGSPGADGAGCILLANIVAQNGGDLLIEVDPSKAVIMRRGRVSQAVHATWETLAELSVNTATLSGAMEQ